MPASTTQFGMFQKRLGMILITLAIALLPLIGRLGRLTLVRGADLRIEAEGELISRVWKPTVRGQILDRKGRVLAKDRPSFQVAVDYDIIVGGETWARKRAARAVRSQYRAEWPAMPPDERQARIDAYMPALLAHLDQMWEKLAEVAAIPIEQIQRRRDDIRREVDTRYSAVVNARLSQELVAQLALGRELTSDVESEVQKRASRDIEEQRSPHAILPSVDDAAAFALQRLVDQRTQVYVPDRDGNPVAIDVPLLPGVSIVPSGDRDYPFDRLTVPIDLSTLPSPVRGSGAKRVTVEGVAYHLLGRLRQGAFGDGKEKNPDGSERTIPGLASLRRARVANDTNFADRVLTPEALPGLAERVDRGEYQEGDFVGLSGIEEAREGELRGLRGLVVEQRETGEKRDIPPQPGHDVRLTIDIMLQARVQAAMSTDLGLAVAQPWHGKENPTVPIGTPLNGAAVVIDVDTGDVLAMVSTPTISREALRESTAVFTDPINKSVDLPWLDRSISRPYPPGSIAKALILNAAVKLGKTSLDTPIDCAGHLFPDQPKVFRCWIYKQFGMTHTSYFGHQLSAPEALMVSCNIYFYTLGQRLGPEGIAQAYRMFGLGDPIPLGLETPSGGSPLFLGYLGHRANNVATPASSPGIITPEDAIQMGIGQGPVAWTPLHAADAYATLARAGLRIRPHVIEAAGAPEPVNLNLDPRALEQALEGLKASANDERGTGHHLSLEGGVREPHFNAKGVQIWGKTGTATAPTIYVSQGDPLYDRAFDPLTLGMQADDLTIRAPEGKRILRWGDHSWFVTLVGRAGENRPRYAISVMMEYAGSGGKVSGPIMNQIIHALIAEGYL